ncbi:MAG: SPASM domain-containing protein, partial [Candidatus Rifleibacteriota bacterium]
MAIPAMEMIRSLGIDGFMINRFNAGFPENHKAAGDLFLEDKGFYDWLGDLENYGSANNFQIHFAIPIPPCALPRGKIFPHLAFSFCPIGREAEYLTVSPNGDLRPCNHLPVILGNLCDETIEEILQKEKYQKFLHELGDPPEFCRGCVAWKSCRGGCRGAAFSWSGTLKRHDPWLDKIRASKI